MNDFDRTSNVSASLEQESVNTQEPKRKRIEFEKFYKPCICIFIPCFIYAFCRYTINHHEPLYDIPFYLVNKVFAVASVIMMSLSYLIGPMARRWKKFKGYLGHRIYLGVGGFFLALVHVIMSVILLTPNNYKAFFNLETGRFNIEGSFSMLFGTLAIVYFFIMAVISLPPVMKIMEAKQWKNMQRAGIFALWISFAHIAAFGYLSWFNLDKWYGGMPPFSLMGASSIVLILSARTLISLSNKK